MSSTNFHNLGAEIVNIDVTESQTCHSYFTIMFVDLIPYSSCNEVVNFMWVDYDQLLTCCHALKHQ